MACFKQLNRRGLKLVLACALTFTPPAFATGSRSEAKAPMRALMLAGLMFSAFSVNELSVLPAPLLVAATDYEGGVTEYNYMPLQYANGTVMEDGPRVPVPSKFTLKTKESSCFPANTKIFVRKKGDRPGSNNAKSSLPSAWLEEKDMKDLVIGDSVLVSYDNLGNEKFSTVVDIPHRVAQGHHPYLRLYFEGGSLDISEEHLIYMGKQEDEFLKPSFKTVFAGELKPGQLVEYEGRLTPLLKITRVKGKGMYAPHTKAGQLLVNGVRVSCYATVRSELLAASYFWARRLIAGGISASSADAGWLEKKAMSFTARLFPGLFYSAQARK